jgi:hypothetical protein
MRQKVAQLLRAVLATDSPRLRERAHLRLSTLVARQYMCPNDQYDHLLGPEYVGLRLTEQETTEVVRNLARVLKRSSEYPDAVLGSAISTLGQSRKPAALRAILAFVGTQSINSRYVMDGVLSAMNNFVFLAVEPNIGRILRDKHNLGILEKLYRTASQRDRKRLHSVMRGMAGGPRACVESSSLDGGPRSRS